MKSRAFTLIELLVVVLIIGILSAIALPQYQKAVVRAKVVQALVDIKNIDRIQTEYRLANGSFYAGNLSDLGENDKICSNYEGVVVCSVYVPNLSGIFFQWQGTTGNVRWVCYAKTDNNLLTQLCQNYQKEYGGSRGYPGEEGYYYYILWRYF